jgi:S1-C subfamily serine protease
MNFFARVVATSLLGVLMIGTTAQSGEFAVVNGFRSAHFGMTERDVFKAINNDFGIRGNQVSRKVHPNEKTITLGIEVSRILPESGPAKVFYILGYKSKLLIHINVIWGKPVTENPNPEKIIALANQLRNHFAQKEYQKEGFALNAELEESVILVFQGKDQKGRAARLLLSNPKTKWYEAENQNIALTLSYIQRPNNPDVFGTGYVLEAHDKSRVGGDEDRAENRQRIREADRLAHERKLLEQERKKLEALRSAEEKRLEEERKKLETLRLAEEERQQQAQAEKKQPPTPQSGTGSGFFVSKMGHVITNAHVVHNCNKVTVGDNANKQVPAKIINTDRSNDLALLKLSTLEMASAESKSLIQKLNIAVVPLASKGLLRSEDVRLGEKVLVAGYPFGDIFSNTIKVTGGLVSATRGAGDDSGQFQLDAAVQPGNSGGPIYDSSGNIVGVVISQLDKLKMAKAIGSLPENVNFGIKASTVRQFLTSSGLPSKKAEQAEEKSTEQLAEIAKNQALMVMCLQ